MGWPHRMILTYMVVTIMHVPFPVLDGDNLRSGETRSTQAISVSDAYDVDFILLGCDPPDDSDDGPVDDDPENGSTSLFGPSFSCPKSLSQSNSLLECNQQELAWSSDGLLDNQRVVDRRVEIGFRDIPFGKLCQSGAAHQRC